MTARYISALDSVWDTWHQELARFRWQETGGLLMGFWTSDDDLVITHASGPGPKARHGIFRFERDHLASSDFISDIYEHSGGRSTYVGEWHSHPCGGLGPSLLDLRTMQLIAREPQSFQDRPLLVIHASARSRSGRRHRAFLLVDEALVEQPIYSLDMSLDQLLKGSTDQGKECE